MAWIQDSSVVRSVCLPKSGPDVASQPFPSAHALQEFDQWVSGLEPLGTPELEDVRDVPEDPYGVLYLEARRLWEPIGAVIALAVDVFNEANVRRGTELEEVAEVNNDGDPPEVVIRFLVGRLRDVGGLAAAVHGADVEHVVHRRGHHTHFLDE